MDGMKRDLSCGDVQAAFLVKEGGKTNKKISLDINGAEASGHEGRRGRCGDGRPPAVVVAGNQ